MKPAYTMWPAAGQREIPALVLAHRGAWRGAPSELTLPRFPANKGRPMARAAATCDGNPTAGAGTAPIARAAAFFDVDGTLVRINIVHTFAFFATNEPTLARSAVKYLKTLASVPLLWGMDKVSRKGFNQFFYRYYEGMSEDRLLTLAGEMFGDVMKPAIFPGARDLVGRTRAAGVRAVLVSGALDFTIRPLAEHLGADDFITNRLEFLGGRATGKLLHPVVAGATKAAIVRDYCARHDLSLGGCFAYADSASDYPMLAVVGRPAAVNPDLGLRRLAREFDWPVLDLR